MPRSAFLLLDLQVDFLGTRRARLAVDATGALRVIETANAVLRGEALAGALPVLIVNAQRIVEGGLRGRGAAARGRHPGCGAGQPGASQARMIHSDSPATRRP